MFRILVYILFIVLPISAFGHEWDNKPEPTPGYILNHFPICQVGSSLGPRCKVLTNRFTLNDFNFSTMTIGVYKLIIEEDDWFRSFEIRNVTDKTFDLVFVDNALGATYATRVTFHNEWDDSRMNWFIRGETLNYINGKLEKHREGVLVKMSVEFLH